VGRGSDHIEAGLKKAGGNRQRAAEILGMSRSTLWRKLKAHHLDQP
jgi:transcriptional regulator of acetoin/glycerol metabolism